MQQVNVYASSLLWNGAALAAGVAVRAVARIIRSRQDLPAVNESTESGVAGGIALNGITKMSRSICHSVVYFAVYMAFLPL